MVSIETSRYSPEDLKDVQLPNPEKDSEREQSASEAGQERWENAKEFGAAVVETGRQRFGNLRERASGLGVRTRDSVKNFFNRAKSFGFALLAPDVAIKHGATKTVEASAQAYDWGKEKVENSYEYACEKAEQLAAAAVSVKERAVDRVNEVKEKTTEKATAIKGTIVERVKSWHQSYVEKVQARADQRQAAKLIRQREKYQAQFENTAATLEGLKAQIAHIEQMMDVLPQRIEATNEIIAQLEAGQA